MGEEPKAVFYADLIEEQGRTLGDKPYVIHDDLKVSFAEFDRATCRAANGLSAQGAKPGDGIAVLMNNCVAYLYLFY